MRLMHQHDTTGPGLIVVQAPELPVFIRVDPDTPAREVDILADRGQAARSWPSGSMNEVMNMAVGRPSFIDSLKDALGLRQGSMISGGGTVVSAGRGSIAAGGSITNCSTGDGATVFTKGQKRLPTEPGVHLTVPLRCTFRIKEAQSVTVLWDSAELTLEAAAERQILEIKR
jgi:hypothetical protein